MNCNRFFISSLTSVSLGVLIYLLFRASSLKVFSWFGVVGVKPFITRLRNWIGLFSHKLPEWILYSLPDGLWVFAYMSLILSVWKGVISYQSIFWLAIVPLISIVLEICQFLDLVKGTFDFLDIIFYLIGGVLPFLIFNKSINYNNLNFLGHEKN